MHPSSRRRGEDQYDRQRLNQRKQFGAIKRAARAVREFHRDAHLISREGPFWLRVCFLYSSVYQLIQPEPSG